MAKRPWTWWTKRLTLFFLQGFLPPFGAWLAFLLLGTLTSLRVSTEIQIYSLFVIIILSLTTSFVLRLRNWNRTQRKLSNDLSQLKQLLNRRTVGWRRQDSKSKTLTRESPEASLSIDVFGWDDIRLEAKAVPPGVFDYEIREILVGEPGALIESDERVDKVERTVRVIPPSDRFKLVIRLPKGATDSRVEMQTYRLVPIADSHPKSSETREENEGAPNKP